MRMHFVALGLIACSSPSMPVAPATPATPAVAQQPASAPPVEPALEPAMPTLRLPRNFLPTGYTARLAIDPAQSGFDGSIAIAGNVAQRSSVIWLHGYQLDVARAVARRGASETALTVSKHGEDLLELRAATPLDVGAWTLALDYTGKYDELNTTGAFKQTVRGEPYIYTQFEALYARRVFPCLDEPDNKVPWKLTIDVPARLVAVSNTPIEREQPLGGDRRRVEFAQTKPLPTYLVAFGVGPFDIVDAGKTASGTPVRIVTMKDRAPEAAWAAKTTPKLMDMLEEFFGSKYPYEKMDMLAIPVTVGFGAMENAGLITFTETLMLLDPKRPAKEREYSWIVVAAHELAHQWFGNLVTMNWWDDIWLNEGFANWAERKVSARFEPGWNEALAEITERNSALTEDGLVSARQIRQPIANAGDILNVFDGITYQKGQAVLNMFEGYVGPTVFLRGIREYLAQHSWGNATSNDFAAAISKAAGKDITTALATFLEQPGAPEITATLVCDRGQPPRVTLSQQRYVPPGAPPAAALKPWHVPVCVAFDRGGKRAEACSLLDAPTGAITLDAAACPRWMMPNVEGRGYYRNVYTAAQVSALRDDAWAQLKPAERRVMFFDATDAVTLGKLPLSLVLSFVPRLFAAGDRFSIRAALEMPIGAREFVPDELRPTYEAWLRKTFGPAARKFGWAPKDGDSIDIEAARSGVLRAVAGVGREPVLTAEAVKLAAKWRDLPQSIRGQVVALAAHASPPMFERLLREVYTETDRARRQEIVGALASVPDVVQQRAALALMLDPKMDIRDTQFMLFGADRRANRLVAQQFVKENKDALMKRIPSDGTTGGQSWLAYVFTSSCSAESRDEVVAYVNLNFAGLAGGERIVKQAIEGMDQCIARRKLLEPEIRSWLSGIRTGSAPAKAAKATR
jgi:cytosol alanyl aminopeptidase